jgi:type III secretion protein V
MMSPAIQRLLQRAAMRQDLMLVVLLVTTILMMILPLPTVLIDALIAANLALTVVLLMVGIYLRDPLDFSTLPAVILISTVFRLALSISTTRLILIQADAGQIIDTFGGFVISGNIVVGLVVFLIITIVQFVVITKGAERIAEVSARFTLDALPGKQMSIDSDLRNGDIDGAEARRRRRTLEKESQLYGAMDGAMKFVKGDAIAGLVIIAVNLIGGLLVGTLQHGMALSEALHTYSLLTVGDGLVMQIPALFVSITAGTIVTRVTTDEARNLGADIANQLVAERRTLPTAAVVLLVLALVPGFPSAIFVALAAVLGAIALVLRSRRKASAPDEADKAAPTEPGAAAEQLAVAPTDAIVLELGSELHAAALADGLRDQLVASQARLFDQLGVQYPPLPVLVGRDLAPLGYRLLLDGVPIAEGDLPLDRLLLRDDEALLELVDLAGEPSGALLGQDKSIWLDMRHRATLDGAGIGYMTPAQILAAITGDALARYAGQLVGVQETQRLLDRMIEPFGDLVREAQRVVPVQRMAEVFRRLLDENVSIRNLRAVLEALVEWGQKEQDVALLTEYVRSSLKRQICHAHAGPNRMLAAHILERDLEQTLRESIRETSVGAYLAPSDDVAQHLIDTLRSDERPAPGRPRPVVLSSMDIRRFVRGMLVKNGIDLPVLSYQELSPEFAVHPISTVRAPAGSPRRGRSAAA